VLAIVLKNDTYTPHWLYKNPENLISEGACLLGHKGIVRL